MGADATINIDVMLANLPKFKNDVSFVDDVLTKLGMNTGSKIDDSFKSETAKIETIAKSMKKDVDQTLDKPVKFTIKADNSDAEKDVKATKAFLKDIPKSKITELKADNDGMALKIQSTKDGIGKIPTTKKTVVDLENTEFNQQVETTKKKIVRFPKELKTKIIADAEEQGIKDFDKLLKKLPYEKKVELRTMAKTGEAIDYKKIIAEIPNKKETILDADATQAKSETKELGDTAQKTESKFMSLKDKLTIGAVAGIASSAIQVITGSFSELIGESVQASDSIDKFKSTMKLGGFGEKEINEATKIVQKYADDTVYDLSTVSNTTAQLAANGIKNYTELTQAAGNLNAQAGGSAETFKAVAMMLTQTAGAGKLTTENWNQLADAIPGASGVLQKAMVDNGAYTGNFRDAMEEGEISADEFNQAITKLGMNDGAIQAAKTTTTFEGAIGNLQANIVGGINDIIKHLGKDKLTGIINGASDSVVGLFQHVSDVFSYLDKNKSTIGNITGNVKDLAGALISGAWDQGKDILLAVADMFGLIDDNTKKIKDPLKQLDKIIENLADNKDKVELLGKALVTMFAVKKGFEFISMINQARKSLLEFTAVEKATSFLSGGFGNTAKAGATQTVTETAATVAPAAVGGTGIAAKLGSLATGLAKLTPVISVIASVPELFKKGSAGEKAGGFLGGIGGGLGGAKLGATIGTMIAPGIGTAIGAVLGGAAGQFAGSKFGSGFVGSLQESLNGKPLKPKVKKTKAEIEVEIDEKKISKKITPAINKLNKELLIKMGIDTKSAQKAKKESDKFFEEMGKDIDDYYDSKQKRSKKDLDLLVKQGVMTRKEADKLLKKEQKNNDASKKSKKDALIKMQTTVNEYYKKVEDIQNDSSKSEKQKNKELNKLRKKFVKDYVADQFAMSGKAVEAIESGAKEQEDLLKQLRKKKGKLSAKDLEATQEEADKLYEASVKPAKKTRDDVIKAADKKYKETVKAAKRQRDETGTLSQEQYEKVVKEARKQRDETKSAAKNQYKEVTSKAKEQHDKVSGEISAQKSSVVRNAQEQAREHIGASQNETGTVQGSWDGLKSNLSSIVEAIAHGIGKLIGGLNKDWGKGLRDFKFGAHAKGTSGLPEDEIALVGEEGFELAHHPAKGIFAVGSQGPEIRPLQAGTSILPHEASKQFLSMTKGLPAHANGVWGTINNIADWIKEKAESAEEFVFDGADKLYNTVTDKLGISKFLDSLGDSAEFKVAKGGLNTVKDNVIKYAQSLFDQYQEEFGSSGSFDGSIFQGGGNFNGVYAYLVEVAKKVMAKFPGLIPTSGYRAGDQYHHGRHQAIDISGYPVGSSRYTEAANYAFEKFPRDVGYVITNGRVRDRIGFSGTGVHDGWATWPAGDHFDHVHISGSKGAGDIYSGGSNSSGKSPKPTGSHENWMRMAGFKPSEYGAINYIVNHESSWNPSATNPSSGAYGLPQSLPASKLASAGSDWRTNPITQLRWMRNYVNERYGGANGALSFWKAHNWYANGGEVDKPTLAWIGEDPNYAKEFIINPAKDSADALIQKAIAAREQYKPTAAVPNATYSSNSRSATKSEQPQIIEVHVKANIDKKELVREIAKPIRIELDRNDRLGRRARGDI
ncbi:aggregation-promoting factor C-terminal-like domain-containing protein [Enterococcus dongliensis]|uniref:aggregation-promoting factor C-terminal-like domain-containing protein n=1 Tax=Enterococcus dongliensis TaxID=2559925 RepID=UPI00288D27D8|nr:tape measure protein [Enterococcus dongliensis]MDT2614379.1 tape measure protein [Enterococcus dongliensis]